MTTVIGIALLIVLVCALVGRRNSAARTRAMSPRRVQPPTSRTPPPAAVPTRPAPPARSPNDLSDTIGGWMLGHQIARGHHGFPGDPLPRGHLGSPSDLAFWGSVFDDDPDDPDF